MCKEGKKVDNATWDKIFQALKKFGRDLIEQAGKLDPAIGKELFVYFLSETKTIMWSSVNTL